MSPSMGGREIQVQYNGLFPCVNLMTQQNSAITCSNCKLPFGNILNSKVFAKLDIKDSIFSCYYVSQMFLFISICYLPWPSGSSNLTAVHFSPLVSDLFPLASKDRSTQGTLFKRVWSKGARIFQLVQYVSQYLY